jgi:hypothetical protein
MNLLFKRSLRLLALVLLVLGLAGITYLRTGTRTSSPERPRNNRQVAVPEPSSASHSPSAVSASGSNIPHRSTATPPRAAVAIARELDQKRSAAYRDRQEALRKKQSDEPSRKRTPSPNQQRVSPETSSHPGASEHIQISPRQGFHEVEGKAYYNSARYGATLGEGWVEVGAPYEIEGLGIPQLAYVFEEARLDGQVIAQGGTHAPRLDQKSGAVTYDRPALEEIYVPREEGLEQSFIFRDLPSRGALTITGMISTNLDPPSEGTEGARLAFTHKDEDAGFISDAVAIDATGRKLSLKMSYGSGRVSINVPAEWMAEATLPITIDPLIGTTITVSGSNLVIIDTQDPIAVGYGSVNNEWLVVWKSRLVGSAYPGHVYAQRVSSSGALVGGVITVSPLIESIDSTEVAISYAPNVNRYLVAWDASARLLNGDGTFYSAAFAVDTTGGRPAVAYDGASWFVVLAGIVGRFISSTGTVGPPITIATETMIFPKVAFNGSVYMIAWQGYQTSTMFGRIMDANGNFQTPVTTLQTGVFSPKVTGSSSKFLISWVDTSTFNFSGRVVNASLGFDSPIFTMASGTSLWFVSQQAAYSETNGQWFMGYDPFLTATIFGRRIDLAGTAAAPEQISNDGKPDTNCAVAWNSATNEMLVVWRSMDWGQQGQYQHVNGQRYTTAALLTPQNFAGTAQSTNSIQWTWQAVSGATGYVIHENNHTPIATVGAVTSYTENTGLNENTQYSRHVHATNANGSSNPSNTAAKYTKIHNPTTADFTLTVVSSSQINVVVAPPPGSTSGSTGVKIERQNGNKWTLLQNFAANYTYQDTGRSANTTYTYRITFQNGDAVASSVSPTQSVATSVPAVAPTGLAGAAQSTTSIQWSWNEIIGETGYNVYDTSNALKGSTSANIHTWLESTGLAENGNYTRYVKAFNGVGIGPASANASRYTLMHDAQVVDFNLAIASTTQINITVTPPVNNPSLDSTGCLIERSTDNANWGIAKPFSSTYSLNDQNLTPGQIYYYRIQYRNGNGLTSAFSPSQSRVTSLVPVITTPSKKTRNQNTTIQGTGIVGSLVTVYFNGNPESGTATVNSGGAWSYAVATKPEGVYTVTATATLGGPPSAASNSIQVTVDTTAPAPPSNIRIACYNNTIDVLWDSSPSSDVAGYQVSRKLGPGGAWNILNTSQLILGNQYRDGTALNGQQYFYRVTALDDALSD